MTCGDCIHWRCDDLLLLKGHCVINRLDKFHGAECATCVKYESKWEYIRPATEREVKNGVYNKKLLNELEDRFDKLQAYLFRSFDGEEDLYSFIASIIYDKDYADCCEIKDGKPNPEGKELRDRVKQFLIPVVVECGGISESEKD